MKFPVTIKHRRSDAVIYGQVNRDYLFANTVSDSPIGFDQEAYLLEITLGRRAKRIDAHDEEG